jgi:arginine/lysine/histidine transporter system substrate-binding protein
MKREYAVLGMVILFIVGGLIGWIIPGLFTTSATQTPLLDQIQTRGEFIVGTSADYPPFENKTYPGGVITGFDIDLSQMIADEIGVDLHMVDMDFDSLIGACQAGTIDMIAAAMTYNPTRAEQIDPSITYITSRSVVIVLNDSDITITSLDNLTDYTVGVQSGTVMQEELVDLGMTLGVDLIAYPRATDLMQNLDLGTVDAVYVDGPIFNAYSATYDIKIIYSSAPDPLALWVRHGQPTLLYQVNKVIFDSYQDGSMVTLINKWFGNVTA